MARVVVPVCRAISSSGPIRETIAMLRRHADDMASDLKSLEHRRKTMMESEDCIRTLTSSDPNGPELNPTKQ